MQRQLGGGYAVPAEGRPLLHDMESLVPFSVDVNENRSAAQQQSLLWFLFLQQKDGVMEIT